MYKNRFCYFNWYFMVVNLYNCCFVNIFWYVCQCNVVIQCWGESIVGDNVFMLVVLCIGKVYWQFIMQYVFFGYYQINQFFCIMFMLYFQGFMIDKVMICWFLGDSLVYVGG